MCTSCGSILQNHGTKNFHDPITNTSYYKSLNGRQQDFIYLKTICEKYFPKADQYFPKAERIEKEKEILSKLAKSELTDLEFRLYLKSYVSYFENQHTVISLKGVTVTGVYPFIPFNKDSSYYIQNLTKDYSDDVIGQKIIALNEIPIKEYEKKFSEFISAENETTKRKQILFWINRPSLYEFISGKKIDSIKLSLENKQSIWLKKITAGTLDWQLTENDFPNHPVTKYKDRLYDYQIIDSLHITYFQFHACYDKIEVKEGMKLYVKPWIRPFANLYVNIQSHKKKPSEQLKKYIDPERPIFNDYVSKMIKESNSKSVTKLIIDLRNNNGGSEMICLQLLYHITEKENLKDFSVYIQNGAHRAQRSRTPADGRQHRRRRGRHLQGQVLSGARPAPFP